MKHLLFVPFMLFCLIAVGQVTYPYNPDGNADGDIAVGDLQDFLVNYGNPFSPSEIQVGDSSLTYWVEQLSVIVQEQQGIIDSLSSVTGRMSLGETVHSKFYELPWQLQLNNGNQYLSILDFDLDGFVRLSGGNSDLTFAIVPDTASFGLYSDALLAQVNFTDSYWRRNYPQQTIPLNSNENIVLFGNNGVLEQATASGEMNVFWTPIHDTALNEGQEVFQMTFTGGIGEVGNEQDLDYHHDIVSVFGNTHAENGCSGCSYFYTLNLPDCQCNAGKSIRILNNLGYNYNSPSLKVKFAGDDIAGWYGPSFVDFVWTGSNWMVGD